MITTEIEKEIQQDNKIFMGLNLRQIICLAIAIVLCVLITLMSGTNMDISIYPCGVIGLVAFAFGWIKKDGLTFERLLLKKMQTYYYKNSKRFFKTRNKYVKMLNEEYRRRAQIDAKLKEKKKVNPTKNVSAKENYPIID